MAQGGRLVKIAGKYSFNNGERVVTESFPQLLNEVKAAITLVNAGEHKTKISKEKTMAGKVLYKPASINSAFKAEFAKSGWRPVRVSCEYPTTHYLEDYLTRSSN